ACQSSRTLRTTTSGSGWRTVVVIPALDLFATVDFLVFFISSLLSLLRRPVGPYNFSRQFPSRQWSGHTHPALRLGSQFEYSSALPGSGRQHPYRQGAAGVHERPAALVRRPRLHLIRRFTADRSATDFSRGSKSPR